MSTRARVLPRPSTGDTTEMTRRQPRFREQQYCRALSIQYFTTLLDGFFHVGRVFTLLYFREDIATPTSIGACQDFQLKNVDRLIGPRALTGR